MNSGHRVLKLTEVFARQEVISEEPGVQLTQQVRAHRHTGAALGRQAGTDHGESTLRRTPAPASASSYLIAASPTEGA